VWCICKANVSYLDENIAALWVWLNSSKSDDLRTNAFRTSTKCKSHGKKHLLVVTIVVTLQEVKINVYFVLISKSSPTFWAIGQNVDYFSDVLIEILFASRWKHSFAKLPISKLSLHNSAAFCLQQKLRRDLPENLTF